MKKLITALIFLMAFVITTATSAGTEKAKMVKQDSTTAAIQSNGGAEVCWVVSSNNDNMTTADMCAAVISVNGNTPVIIPKNVALSVGMVKAIEVINVNLSGTETNFTAVQKMQVGGAMWVSDVKNYANITLTTVQFATVATSTSLCKAAVVNYQTTTLQQVWG